MRGADALRSFLRRVGASSTAEQRALVRRREAVRVGMTEAAWLATDRSALDLELLRALHRGVVDDQRTVRQVRADGEWTVAAADPGKLRPKAQAFRVGDHVEPAWEQRTLRARLVDLLRGVSLDPDPIREVARLLSSLARAQPFVGANEHVALALAAWAFRRVGLPVIHAHAIESDAAYGSALVAATERDASALEQYLAGALWDEALALAEWLAVVPPSSTAQWTLRDEHAALGEARRRAVRIDDAELAAFAEAARACVGAALATRIDATAEPARQLDAMPARLQETWNSATRGHAICPHESILVYPWQLGDRLLQLVARLVIASAGRGITGALSVQLAIEVAEQPVRHAAPAFLIIPDEDAGARLDRFRAWTEHAIVTAVSAAPLRL